MPDDEALQRMDRLDYSPESAERPYDDPEHDERGPREHDGRAPNHTSFDASEAPDGSVERDGKVYDKWEWLARLNENAHTPLKTTKKRQAERKRDVEILVQSTNEFAAEHDLPHVLTAERVFSLLDTLVEVEGDFQFGSVPVEVPILAALSMAANEQGWMIRQSDLFEEYVQTYIPDDNDADRGEIMRMRQRIREALDED
jgi:hypothetical protein